MHVKEMNNTTATYVYAYITILQCCCYFYFKQYFSFNNGLAWNTYGNDNGCSYTRLHKNSIKTYFNGQ